MNLFFALFDCGWRVRNTLLAAGCVFLVTILMSTTLYAQSDTLVTDADCISGFPECRLYLDEPALPDDWMSAVGVQLGSRQNANVTVGWDDVGARVVFAFDEYVSAANLAYGVRGEGRSGALQYVEFTQAAIDFYRFARKGELADRLWLAAIKTGDPALEGSAFPAIVDDATEDRPPAWSSGRNGIIYFNNALVNYEPPAGKNTPSTPLYGLLNAAIDTFAVDQSAPPQAAKHIIVFTNGVTTDQGEAGVLRRASRANIRIHTVMLGQGNAATLARLAAESGGQTLQFTGREVMTPLWSVINESSRRPLVQFPVTCTDNRLMTLTVGQQRDSQELRFPNFMPPTVTIVEPTQGMLIQRNLATADAPLVDATPTEMAVQLTLQYSDGYNHLAERVNKIIYSLNDRITREQIEPPFGDFRLPIRELDSGEQTLWVRVEGQCNEPSVEESISFRVEVLGPTPLPEPTVTDTPTPIVDAAPSQDQPVIDDPVGETTGTGNTTPGVGPTARVDLEALLTLSQRYLPYLAGGGLLFIAMLTWLFYPRRKTSGITFSSDPPNEDITEPEDATEPATDAFPIATLTIVRGEQGLPPSIALHRQSVDPMQSNQWSFGRSYQESDHVIDSRRVSRLHATIIEQSGLFQIRDEGSSGGTYITTGPRGVRRKIEPMIAEPLFDQDIINFNSVAYRFEIDQSEFSPDATEPESERMGAHGSDFAAQDNAATEVGG